MRRRFPLLRPALGLIKQFSYTQNLALGMNLRKILLNICHDILSRYAIQGISITAISYFVPS